MKEMDKVGRYLEMAEPFHCDFSHRLFIGHLGNHMLNAADFHSRDRGFGMDFLNSIRKTWVESAMRYFTQRNFRVVAADGDNPDNAKVFGYGRSIWAMIDTETRQPTNIFDIDDGAIMKWVEKDKVNPMTKLTRVQMDDNARLVRSIDTFYNDVDINGHINSVKYIEHVLDLFPLDWYKEHPLKRFDIAYVAEAHQGDRLNFYQEEDADEELCYKIRITKTVAGSGDEVETCRSKVKFV